MKKTILSFLLVGSASLVMAQQPTSSNANTNRNNTNNNTNLNNNSMANPVNSSPSTNVPMNTTPPPTTVNNATETNVNTGNQPYQPMNNNQSNASNIDVNTNNYRVTVPVSIQASFGASYPQITNTSWQQSGDWYQARYVENGMIRQVSYREDGKVLNTMFSPIRRSYVPDEMVSQAIEKYGASLYAIGATKGSDGQEIYHVTVIENGQSRTEWMNANGTASENQFRKTEEATAATQENVQQTAEPVASDDTKANTTETISPE